MTAKKKPVAKRAKSTKPVKKTASVTKSKVISVKAKASAKPAAKKSAPVSKPAVVKKPEPAPDVSLGRPLVTQEEKLYMLFKDDFPARQIFEFLRVQTVKELEQYSPSQIVRTLSKPLTNTVERIRQRLAEMKRSLREDEDFAAEFLASHRSQIPPGAR